MSDYVELSIDDIELDRSNPRIANYLDLYDEDELTSDTMALLLGTTSDSCASLRESIKENGGIVHPIIVNHFRMDDMLLLREIQDCRFIEILEKRCSWKLGYH